VRTNRRNFLTGLGVTLPLSSALGKNPFTKKADRTTNHFKELSVPSFINAIGPYSSLGGAEMWPEVIEAMDYAINHKIRVSELHDAVGKRIAELLGTESAMVSAGATSAIILGTAACMTMGDEVKMERLPNTSGMPNEVIILKSHRYLYDRSIKAPGARLIEVETADDIRAAINDKTAMMFYLLNRPEKQKVRLAEYVALAKEFDIPSFCDAATTVPPISNIFDTVDAGFDLICYSGGKGLRGPYSAGLLMGRADLVSIARLNGSPNH
ncbi:uncharacterized protein METZ01_LOCUS271841, partial [marine metagenome]